MAKIRRDDAVRGYEPFDERIRPVVAFTIWLAVGTVAVCGLMVLAHGAFARAAREGSAPIHPLAQAREEPPEPRLQAAPSTDLQAFQARELERLSSYGWVDRTSEIVHVPIERAMELVAREGLPAKKEGGK